MFWSWIGVAPLHGIVIYSICMIGFNESNDGDEVKSISLNEQSTLVFTVIIHVIFYKLYLELEGRTELSLIVTALTLVFYYAMVALLTSNITVIAILHDGELRGMTHYTFFSTLSILIIITGAILVITPDFAFHSFRYLLAYRRHIKYE